MVPTYPENIDVELMSRNIAPLRSYLTGLEIPLGVRGTNHFTRLQKLKIKITDDENNMILPSLKLDNCSLQKLTIAAIKMNLHGLTNLKSLHLETAVIDSDTFDTLPETATKIYLIKCAVSGTLKIKKNLQQLNLWHSFPEIDSRIRSKFTSGVKLTLTWLPDDNETNVCKTKLCQACANWV
ncbi:unnamed protein product [Ambrosiozyma monospora]|uniref:Unnamed protein product n=1 Tax=Ambrosiozyma monospora TaxID=43982 RepID=A0ACB5SX89_AMBMO|nr:unnamed protein product [Ambrosiozyma monospora]